MQTTTKDEDFEVAFLTPEKKSVSLSCMKSIPLKPPSSPTMRYPSEEGQESMVFPWAGH